MSFIDVKYRVDGVNVERGDGCKMPYGVEYYPNYYNEGYSVLVDVKIDDMVNVLDAKGYEVIKKEVSV